MVWDLRSLCDKADYAIIRYAINRIRLYKELASVTLRNFHEENDRAKSECSVTLFYFLNFVKLLGFGLDLEQCFL